jgi:mannose-1-phosphate guanylyltransferase
MSRHAVILAGGRGTRFWPRSRRDFPKQLLGFTGKESLLQATVTRLGPLVDAGNFWVLTSENLRREVLRQLPGIPRSQVIAEPVQRNTAPAIGLAAELIFGRDQSAVMGVFPSDHVVARENRFRTVASMAFEAAARDRMVVLGVRPRWAETGYGYIEFPEAPSGRTRAIPIRRFTEKPAAKDARRFVRAGRYFWNSGMFFWKAAVYREALGKHLPATADVLAAIAAIARQGKRRLPAALRASYGDCENISVDYAILERASNVVGIPCDIGWNDIGSWRAAYDLLRGTDANVLRSEALLIDSDGLYVDAPGKLVAVVGVRDLVIVDTPDALLIVPRDRAQEVSKIVAALESERRDELL